MTRRKDKVKDISRKRKQFTTTENNLKPILFSMKVVGIYFDPSPGTNKVSDEDHKDTRTSWIGSRMYCYLVLLLLWFNSIRSAVGLFPLDKGVSVRAILAMWYLQCAINATIMVVSCHKLQHFQLFFKHWDACFLSGVADSINCKYKSVSKYTLIMTSVGWLFSFTNISLTGFVTFQTHFSKVVELSMNMTRPFPDALWSKVLVGILVFYETGACLLPVIFVIVVSRMIRTQFANYHTTLSRHIKDANDTLPSQLAELRFHYLKLSKAVEIINETFKWMLGFSLLLAIVIACFISYQLVSDIEDTITVVAHLFWLTSCFFFIILLTLSTAGLHQEAQGSTSIILTTGTKNATPEEIGQLNLFITKLTAVPVGFTVVDFFLMTNEFLLTVGAFYLTYFFLILQFKIS